MKRAFVTLAAVMLATCTVTAVPAFTHPAVAAPDPAPDSPLPAELRAAMERDLDQDWPELRTRLNVEAAAPAQEAKLRARLGPAFGGAWLAEDGSTLVVGVTDAGRTDEIRAAGARPQVVERSAAALDTAKAALDQHAKAAGTAVHGWFVNPARNEVIVQADDRPAAEAFTKAAGVKDAHVELRGADMAYRPVYDTRGGDEFHVNLGNGYIAICSVGFAVSGGFVTAGHCGSAGQSTSGAGVDQGTVRASQFPGADMAWVQVNSSWKARPVVNNHSGGTVQVTGSQEVSVGGSACRSGRTTGWRCGTVQGKNVTVNYNGQLVHGLTATSACAEPGDSGGSFLSGTQAQGVTSGAGGNCSSGGTSVYQPVNPILSAYRLALVTPGNTNRLVGYAGKCIDVPGGNPADGSQLQIHTCNGTSAQDWTFAPDGTVRGMGMCMDVAWGSTADGANVQIANCSGNPAQQFVLSGAGDLVNPQANKCVDVKDWNSADGAKLQIWTCGGGSNQKWARS
ncbi:ricin-type beta-trefoil lectin domain protein [Nonomuraea sp. NPDC050643]|uniref:ricin-type beta-trefoil lectin domain protein n=1 Tax=Nonomuraea sp. NPDC050643 TaxID=3155660 RepID=UPI0033C773D4